MNRNLRHNVTVQTPSLENKRGKHLPWLLKVLFPAQFGDSERLSHNQQGFTLLKLMLMMLIIGGSTSLAWPAYLQYVAHSQASESLNFLGTLKGTVMEYYVTNKTFPDWDELVKTSSLASMSGHVGKYSNSLFAIKSWVNPTSTYTLVANFNISAVSAPLQKMAAIYLQTTDAGKTWNCGPSTTLDAVYQKYLPSTCRKPITVQ